MTLDDTPAMRQPKPRTEAQKMKRRALWLARAGERRALEEGALTRRYDELKIAMASLGVRIGPIADLAQRIEDPVRRFEVLKARLERWEALWVVTQRKRLTRGKIVIGGALLAELEEVVMDDPNDQAFLMRIKALLDRRVPRVQDRVVIRGLLAGASGLAAGLPLRPGGPPDEILDAALAALGERPSGLSGAEEGEEDPETFRGGGGA